MRTKASSRSSRNAGRPGQTTSFGTEPMPTKKSSNSGLDDILKKSAKLMAKQGYHGTSMRDLAQSMGHSLSGLYHYFDSKDDLLFKINERGFSSLLGTARGIVEQQISPADLRKAVIGNQIEFFSDHMSEMRVMMFGHHDIDRKRSQIIVGLKDEYASIVKQVVGDYMQSLPGKRFTELEISRQTYLLL